MKAKYAKTFAYGKSRARTSIILAVVTGLAGRIAFPSGSIYQTVAMIVTVALLAATIYIMCKYCRCPYCGKRIIVGMLTATNCPSCRRNLESGKKYK